ncbi:MAG: hypothetical protein EOP06_25795 [Proteobacteria bacterium]|nr:MAG: hypothetical protein EOP06_25795 [Pseudomonadota bacterium]
MTKDSPGKLGFKIVTIAIAMIGVFYIMGRMRADESSQSTLDSFFAADVGRPLNWCPADVVKLESTGDGGLFSDQAVTIQSYCQLMAESFDSSTLDPKTFKPILRAVSASGKVSVLELDASGKVFRYQGLPFGSKQLSRLWQQKIPH